MNLSEAKLRNGIGEFRLATPEGIMQAGAAAGYASPVGLMGALIVVDDLIPQSSNLAAGANEAGYHLLNTNCGRDYSPEIIADLVQAKSGDPCEQCGNLLTSISAISLATRSEFNFENILLALAEIHHDDKGLTLPKSAAPFDVYLMHIAGKEMDTRAKAEEICDQLQSAGFIVLFDDRDERAGVKFNDADQIGCPIRITVGEKNLKDRDVAGAVYAATAVRSPARCGGCPRHGPGQTRRPLCRWPGFAHRLPADKTRVSDTEVKIGGLIGRQVKGFVHALVYDDEIATAGSVVELSQVLVESGIQRITLVCTHGLFLGPAIERIKSVPQIQEVITTDTVERPLDRRPPNLTVLSVSHVFAESIRQNYLRRSIGELFEGLEV